MFKFDIGINCSLVQKINYNGKIYIEKLIQKKKKKINNYYLKLNIGINIFHNFVSSFFKVYNGCSIYKLKTL